MYISEELAQKHGYAGTVEATRALARAARWTKAHNGKRPPVHISQARTMAVELKKHHEARLARVKSKKTLRLLRLKAWFGALAMEGRVLPARRWLRRRLHLYLNDADMALYFIHVLDKFQRDHLKNEKLNEAELLALFAAIEFLFGLNESQNPYNRPGIAVKVLSEAKSYLFL